MKPPANTSLPSCPYCNSYSTRVVTTRRTPDAITVRRRACKKCGFRFYTTQVLAPPEVHIDRKLLKFKVQNGEEYMEISGPDNTKLK
tara:strand:- start:980 stop:1240 length:261 start_codon:yes stop_codon:yes gene_type:complete